MINLILRFLQVLQPGEGAEGKVMGDRIHSAFAEGIAPQDAAEGHQTAPEQAEPPKGGRRVGGAAGDDLQVGTGLSLERYRW